jgi:hypothetical protein
LLTNAAEALGWIRYTAFRLVMLLALLGTAVVATRLAGLGIEYLLGGIAIAQWITYAVMLKTFITRGVIDSVLVLHSHLVHLLAALAAFGLTFVCSVLLAGTNLFARVGGELIVAIVVCGYILVARSWFPASQILARRLSEVISPENLWYRRLRLPAA